MADTTTTTTTTTTATTTPAPVTLAPDTSASVDVQSVPTTLTFSGTAGQSGIIVVNTVPFTIANVDNKLVCGTHSYSTTGETATFMASTVNFDLTWTGVGSLITEIVLSVEQPWVSIGGRIWKNRGEQARMRMLGYI